MLADVHMRGYPVPDTDASVYWHKDGVFVIFPISPGRYRLIADLPASGQVRPPVPTLEEVQTIIDRRGPPQMVAFDPIWLAGFRIKGRKVSKYRSGRDGNWRHLASITEIGTPVMVVASLPTQPRISDAPAAVQPPSPTSAPQATGQSARRQRREERRPDRASDYRALREELLRREQ
jgi:hypothetical protein